MPVLPPEELAGLQINFPTHNEFVELLVETFQAAEVGHGGHQLAGRCPIYCLTPVKSD
jgi:hypothetical protein